MSVNEYMGKCGNCGERFWDGDETMDIAGEVFHTRCVSETMCPRCGEDNEDPLFEAESGDVVCKDCRISISRAIESMNDQDGPFSIQERYEQAYNARF